MESNLKVWNEVFTILAWNCKADKSGKMILDKGIYYNDVLSKYCITERTSEISEVEIYKKVYATTTLKDLAMVILEISRDGIISDNNKQYDALVMVHQCINFSLAIPNTLMRGYGIRAQATMLGVQNDILKVISMQSMQVYVRVRKGVQRFKVWVTVVDWWWWECKLI